MRNLLLCFIFSTLFCACQSSPVNDKPIENKVQEDINALDQLIQLQIQPIRVNFVSRKAIQGDGSRLAVGPTDYVLEAILYYSPEDFKIIEDKSKYWASSSPFSKNQYNFSWLNESEQQAVKYFSGAQCTPSFYAKQSLKHGGFLVLEDINAVALSLSTM